MVTMTRPGAEGAAESLAHRPQTALPPLAEKEEEGFDFRAPIMAVWRRKWIIAATMVLTGSLGVMTALNMENRYTATAHVIFEPDRLRIIDLNDVVATSDSTALQNQIEILRSAVVLEKVAETLRLDQTPEFNPSLQEEAPNLLQQTFARVPWPPLVASQLRKYDLLPVMAPQGTLGEEADQLKNSIVSMLASDLRLRTVGGSRVIEVSYSSTNGVLAAAIANAVSEQYILAQTEQKRDDITTATELLSVRVRDLENRLNQAEEAVRMAQTDLAAGMEYGSALIARQIETLAVTLSEARGQRQALENRLARASRALQGAEDMQIVPDFRDSPRIAAFRAREVEILDQQTSLQAIVANVNNAGLVRLEARLSDVRASIEEEAGRIIASLAAEAEIAKTREASLAAEMADLEQRALEQHRAEMRLGRLEREAQASRVIYESFLNRMNEASEQAALQSPEARFLTRATRPLGPDNTSRTRLVLMATAAGATLGLGIILLLERLNDTFRNASDIESKTGIPVLAGVPKTGRRRSPRHMLADILEDPDSPLAESVRNLRTSILFSNIDQSPKVIMFASSLPMEGKTTTAMLTAITSQQMERSAIIVDCDLRRRTMSSMFPIDPERPGLLAALQGTSSIDEATYVEPETGLHVLAPERGGHGLGNAADILASRRFQRLIGQLRARYDLVILDTPPTLAVADSRIVAQSADAVVYLVRWNETRRAAVLEGLRELTSVNAKIAGVALSLVDSRLARKYAGNDYLAKYSYGTS